ncbi:MAG: hypothetical protein EZS28_011968 [Streblomastix strix]|uniref:Uncharacterized protein n=1 Tax=Streblomastix strix TaxID=222440 RepID=A0A5J4WC37_9EUKA|nr:MAG: hypothetical protein EZS28_011968 [Streblomastix strix]
MLRGSYQLIFYGAQLIRIGRIGIQTALIIAKEEAIREENDTDKDKENVSQDDIIEKKHQKDHRNGPIEVDRQWLLEKEKKYKESLLAQQQASGKDAFKPNQRMQLSPLSLIVAKIQSETAKRVLRRGFFEEDENDVLLLLQDAENISTVSSAPSSSNLQNIGVSPIIQIRGEKRNKIDEKRASLRQHILQDHLSLILVDFLTRLLRSAQETLSHITVIYTQPSETAKVISELKQTENMEGIMNESSINSSSSTFLLPFLPTHLHLHTHPSYYPSLSSFCARLNSLTPALGYIIQLGSMGQKPLQKVMNLILLFLKLLTSLQKIFSSSALWDPKIRIYPNSIEISTDNPLLQQLKWKKNEQTYQPDYGLDSDLGLSLSDSLIGFNDHKPQIITISPLSLLPSYQQVARSTSASALATSFAQSFIPLIKSTCLCFFQHLDSYLNLHLRIETITPSEAKLFSSVVFEAEQLRASLLKLKHTAINRMIGKKKTGQYIVGNQPEIEIFETPSSTENVIMSQIQKNKKEKLVENKKKKDKDKDKDKDQKKKQKQMIKDENSKNDEGNKTINNKNELKKEDDESSDVVSEIEYHKEKRKRDKEEEEEDQRKEVGNEEDHINNKQKLSQDQNINTKEKLQLKKKIAKQEAEKNIGKGKKRRRITEEQESKTETNKINTTLDDESDLIDASVERNEYNHISQYQNQQKQMKIKKQMEMEQEFEQERERERSLDKNNKEQHQQEKVGEERNELIQSSISIQKEIITPKSKSKIKSKSIIIDSEQTKKETIGKEKEKKPLHHLGLRTPSSNITTITIPKTNPKVKTGQPTNESSSTSENILTTQTASIGSGVTKVPLKGSVGSARKQFKPPMKSSGVGVSSSDSLKQPLNSQTQRQRLIGIQKLASPGKSNIEKSQDKKQSQRQGNKIELYEDMTFDEDYIHSHEMNEEEEGISDGMGVIGNSQVKQLGGFISSRKVVQK